MLDRAYQAMDGLAAEKPLKAGFLARAR